RYTDAEVRAWAARIDAWTQAGSDVYVYFDNDAQGHAPHDAVRLQAAVDALAPAAARDSAGVSASAPP
ncbi:MAG: DUF72 domain-containing protein, partial [Haliangium ochraceum]